MNNAIASKWVTNLSDKKLSLDETSLLSKGMKFSVSCKTTNAASFLAPIEKVICSLPEDESNKIRLSLTTSLYSRTSNPANLTRGEIVALKELRNDSSIIILPADKGRSTVIMNMLDYNKKLDDLLSDKKTYEVVNKDPTITTQNKMNRLLLEYKNKGLLTNWEYKSVHCTNGTIPKFYGLPKIHKKDVPLRPIVSYLSSPCYKLSKFLSEILHKYSLNEYSIQTSEQFSYMVREEKLKEDEICVSFDVVALFTSIPIDMACNAALTALNADKELGQRCNLPPVEIVKLLDLCLNSTTFICRNILYKQKFGTAMGSPVSPTVANLVMNVIEKQALTTFIGAPRIWVRYVDDTFAIIKEEKVDNFLEHLNKINKNIKFTMEREENNKIPFLDVLVQHDRIGNFITSVYRKPTCTDRLLDFNSNHPLSHKVSTIKTLFKRAERISSNENLRKEEENHLSQIFEKNNYPAWIVHEHLNKQKSKSNFENFNQRICLPYVRGISETTKRLLGKHNVGCTFQPYNTLGSLISHPKDCTPTGNYSNIVYSIPCGDCSSCYVGQTKRCLSKRIEEHQNSITRGESNKSAIVDHVINKEHEMNWKEARILHKNPGTFERLFLEGWEVKKNNVIEKNRAAPIPEMYNVLIK